MSVHTGNKKLAVWTGIYIRISCLLWHIRTYIHTYTYTAPTHVTHAAIPHYIRTHTFLSAAIVTGSFCSSSSISISMLVLFCLLYSASQAFSVGQPSESTSLNKQQEQRYHWAPCRTLLIQNACKYNAAGTHYTYLLHTACTTMSVRTYECLQPLGNELHQ